MLSIIGLTRKGLSKGPSIAGTVVASVAFLLAIITFVAFWGSQPSTTDSASTTQQAPEPSASKPAGFNASSYTTLKDRAFALLVKDPATHKGETHVLYGVVTQFDAATGTCAFLASTSNKDESISFEFPQNTLIKVAGTGGKCPIAANIVRGDHLKLYVLVNGAYSYDTQSGGNTTVPSVTLEKAVELHHID